MGDPEGLRETGGALSATLPKMKQSSSSRTSGTNLKRVRGLKDKDIRLSAEHPEADVAHIVKGIVRRGLKPTAGKASISLRVDADVLEWYKSQGPGYQTRINAVLRAYRDAVISQSSGHLHAARFGADHRRVGRHDVSISAQC